MRWPACWSCSRPARVAPGGGRAAARRACRRTPGADRAPHAPARRRRGRVVALTRAAHISPPGQGRSRRFAEAAYIGAEGAGVLADASELLADARRAGPETLHAAIAAVLPAHQRRRLHGHRVPAARRRHRGRSGRRRPGRRSARAGAGLLVERSRGVLAELPHGDPAAKVRAAAGAAADRPHVRRPRAHRKLALADVDDLVAAAHDETDPAVIVRIGVALFYLDRLVDVRDAMWRVVRHGRSGGPSRRHLAALMIICLDHYLTGEWDEAAGRPRRASPCATPPGTGSSAGTSTTS